MFKTILSPTLILITLLSSPSFSHSTGFTITKQVNGSYKSALIANFRPFHSPTVFIDTSLVFSSPRSNVTALNHECFDILIGSSFDFIGGKLDLSTGFSRYWAGNSQCLPDGYIDSSNTASLIWTW